MRNPSEGARQVLVIALAALLSGCTASPVDSGPADTQRVAQRLEWHEVVDLTLTEMRLRTENVSRHSVHAENCLFFRGMERIHEASARVEWDARSTGAKRLLLTLDDPEQNLIFAWVPDGPSPLVASVTDLELDGEGLLRVLVMVNETAVVAEQPVKVEVSIAYDAAKPLTMKRGTCTQS